MLAYDLAGTGPAVLLLHSTVCDRRMWDPQWQPLISAGYQVVRCDFRGFGETPPPQAPWNDAEDAVSLLDELGIGRAAVAGSSFGGRVAQEIAARWPARVTALALLCAGLAGHQPSASLAAMSSQEEALLAAGDIDGATELNVTTWLGPDAAGETRAAVRRMQRHSFEVQLAAGAEPPYATRPVDLAAVTAPALVVSGAHDLTDFREIAARLAAELPGARALELPWAGHLPSLERPAEITALLTGFLRAPAEPVP